MAKKRIRSWTASTFRPEKLLTFWETDEFQSDWNELGLDVENDLLELQLAIMVGPAAHPSLKGTGGLRKMRFAPANLNGGKSGSVRVCYAYFPKHATVLLVVAYGKNEKANLTAEEVQGIKQYLALIERHLVSRSKK